MSYWILQCNPRKYRIFDYWKKYASLLDGWSVRLFKDEIKSGDHAFIWVSNEVGKRNRGIYAKAEVVAQPEDNRPLFIIEVDYWVDQSEKSRLSKLPRLEIRYVKLFADKPLLADNLRKTRGLENLLVLRMPQAGVYKLSESEGRIIQSLID